MSDDQKSSEVESSATATHTEEARSVSPEGQKSPKMEPSSSTSTATTGQNREVCTAASGDLKRGLHDELEDDVAKYRKRCRGDILQKIEYSEPYRFFLSRITAEENTHDEMLTVSFPELFDNKLGILESSLQITFKVETEWLLAQYHVNQEKSTPITIIYGYGKPELPTPLQYYSKYKMPENVNAITYVKPMKLMGSGGFNHAKMMILSYEDCSIRVVVTTGNLIEMDWENTAQGIWISPRLPRIENGPTGENVSDSDTHFKKDLLDYLKTYQLTELEPWIQKMENADCSAVKVFFIASVPGAHKKEAPVSWGLMRMAQLLSQHAIVPNEDVENSLLCYQSSSFGPLGKNPTEWLFCEFTRTMKSSSTHCVITPEVKVIYPCYTDIVSSYDGVEAGRCLSYELKQHLEQSWLNNYLCKWRSGTRHRTRAVPYINTYCHLTSCKKFLYWFLMGSHNMTKAAWGKENKAGTNIQILNYEASVLFIPQNLISKTCIPLTNQSPSEDGPQFSLPYDIPLEDYTEEDQPWTIIDCLPDASI